MTTEAELIVDRFIMVMILSSPRPTAADPQITPLTQSC